LSPSEVACNETLEVNSSAAISLSMTSSSVGDVISRYPPSPCSLYIGAQRGQRLSFTVFTLGGPAESKAWEGQGGVDAVSRVSTGRPCDTRRILYIVDGDHRTSSSLCHLPRFQSRQRLVYTSTDWQVAVYWTWTSQPSTGHSTAHSDLLGLPHGQVSQALVTRPPTQT